MILGTVEEVETKIKQAQSSLSAQSFGTTDWLGNYKFWPNGQIYYSFEASLTSSQRANINEAVEHWRDATMLRFYYRGTGPRIVFRRSANPRDCSSYVGYSGGTVYTNIGGDCGLTETIHEIGHAVALEHEHQRCDRGNFIIFKADRVAPVNVQYFDKLCSIGAQLSSYDPYSIMHYPKYAFAKTAQAEYDCQVRDIDSACPLLPEPSSGIDRDRMGQSTRLTSRDASGIFNYYRDQSPCARNAGGCTWLGFTVGGTRGGSFDFTLSASDQRYMVIQGNQVPVAAGLNKRRADGSYENLQFRLIQTDGYYKFSSGTLPPGSYRWYVHADNANTSGSVDMFSID